MLNRRPTCTLYNRPSCPSNTIDAIQHGYKRTTSMHLHRPGRTNQTSNHNPSTDESFRRRRKTTGATTKHDSMTQRQIETLRASFSPSASAAASQPVNQYRSRYSNNAGSAKTKLVLQTVRLSVNQACTCRPGMCRKP